MGIKHASSSSKPAGPDPTKIQGPQWNTDHIIDSPIDLPLGSTIGGLPFGSGVPGPPGPPLANGDYGDIIVSGSGTAINVRGIAGNYVDLRDYGGYPAWPLAPDLTQIDITAALNAAITDLQPKKNKTLLIPEISNLDGFASNVRLEISSTVTIPLSSTGPGWQILIQAQRLGFRMAGGAGTKGIILPSQIHIKGLPAGLNRAIGPLESPGVNIVGNSAHTLESLFYANGKSNILLEGLGMSPDNIGVNLFDCDTSTLRHCNINTGFATGRAVLIDSSFWINLVDCLLQTSGGAAAYCVEIVEDSGLILMKGTNFGGANAIYLNGFAAGGGGIQNVDIFDATHEDINGAFLTIDSTLNPIDGIRLYRCYTADSTGVDYLIKNIGGRTRGVRVVDCGNARNDPVSTNIAQFEVIQPAQSGSGRIDGFAGAAGTTDTSYGYTFHDSIDKKLLSAQRSPFTMLVDADTTVVQDGSLWTNLGTATRTNNVLGPDGLLNATRFTGDTVAENQIRGIYSKTYAPSVGDWFIGAGWLRKEDALVEAIFVRFFFDLTWGTSGTGAAVNGNTSYGQPIIGVGEYSDVRTNPVWRLAMGAYKLTALGTGNLTMAMFYTCKPNTIYSLYMPSVIFIPAAAGLSDQDVTTWIRTVRGTWPSTAKKGDMIMPFRNQQLSSNIIVPANTFATLPSAPIAGMQRYITDSNTATHGATVAGGGANKVMVWYNGTNWTVMGS